MPEQQTPTEWLAEGRRHFQAIIEAYDTAVAAKATTVDTSVAEPWRDWLGKHGYELMSMASAYAAEHFGGSS